MLRFFASIVAVAHASNPGQVIESDDPNTRLLFPVLRVLAQSPSVLSGLVDTRSHARNWSAVELLVMNALIFKDDKVKVRRIRNVPGDFLAATDLLVESVADLTTFFTDRNIFAGEAEGRAKPVLRVGPSFLDLLTASLGFRGRTVAVYPSVLVVAVVEKRLVWKPEICVDHHGVVLEEVREDCRKYSLVGIADISESFVYSSGEWFSVMDNVARRIEVGEILTDSIRRDRVYVYDSALVHAEY